MNREANGRGWRARDVVAGMLDHMAKVAEQQGDPDGPKNYGDRVLSSPLTQGAVGGGLLGRYVHKDTTQRIARQAWLREEALRSEAAQRSNQRYSNEAASALREDIRAAVAERMGRVGMHEADARVAERMAASHAQTAELSAAEARRLQGVKWPAALKAGAAGAAAVGSLALLHNTLHDRAAAGGHPVSAALTNPLVTGVAAGAVAGSGIGGSIGSRLAGAALAGLGMGSMTALQNGLRQRANEGRANAQAAKEQST